MSTNIIGKVPPSNLDIEKAVLGAALVEKEGCKIICELLTDSVFYSDKHAVIFRAIKSINDKKEPVDILTIASELKRLKQLEGLGGPYAISELAGAVSSSVNTETHCRMLLGLYFKREQIRMSTWLNKEAYDDFTDPFDIIDDLKKKIKEIESYIVSNKIADNNVIIDTVLENSENASKNGGIIGYSTGIKALDLALMGLRKKLKYLIAAQSKVGKSALAKNIAVFLSHRLGIPGVFFSLEVTADMFMLGCISEILEIPNQLIQSGQITSEEKRRIAELKNTLFTRSLIIDDRGGLSPDEIWATLRKLKESHNIQWFCVDYINLMRLKGKEHKGKTKEEKMAEIVNENKNMAKELDLICIELAQFTKEISKRAGGKPNLGDLKDSAALEQSADVIILIHRPEVHGETEYRGMDTMGLAELIIAKNKYGPTKNLAAKFVSHYTKFKDHDMGTEWVPDPF